MPDRPPVRAVCFDLDDTLCVPDRSDQEFHGEVFERAGIDPLVTPAQLRAVGPGEIEPSNGLPEFYANLYRAAARKHGVAVDAGPSLFDELGTIAGEVDEETGVSFRDGAEDALAYVRDRYAVGLVTNGKRATQAATLRSLGIADAFDATVFCDPAVGIDGKPAREPFETVLSALGVPPEAAVHVGDSHPEDVVGAHRAGLRSVWVPTNRPHEEHPTDHDPAPTYRIDSPAELPGIL